MVEQPSAVEFANMLAHIFSGFSQPLDKPETLLEPRWVLNGLQCAVKRSNSYRHGDDLGLVPGMLQYIPDEYVFLPFSPRALNGMASDMQAQSQIQSHFWRICLCPTTREECAPHSWHTTCFAMLAKSQNQIANCFQASWHHSFGVQDACFFFFFGILSRSEPVLDSMQPEEQHGFRRGCWLEEHLVTACPFGWSALICPKHSKPYWQQKAGVQGDAGHGARVCVKPKVFARCFCNGPCENGEQIWRL